MRRRSLLLLLCLATIGSLFGSASAAVPGCADPSDGGEWRSYGVDALNSRNQTNESVLDAGNVSQLGSAWSLTAQPGENMRSVPIVADGCVYVTSFGPGPGLASSAVATVYAANADTGALVWEHRLPAPPGLIVGTYAPAVAEGLVFVAVSGIGSPYVVALDQATGEEVWTSYLYQGLFDPEVVTGINASVVYHEGMLFIPLTGADAIGFSHPAFFILQASTGTLLKRTHVIPEEFWTSNMSGGGIWTTAAVDADADYLYVGTSNPYNKRHEHARANAILKIDMDPKRFTFGEIVSSYKGDVDYNPERFNSPECKYLAELIIVGFSTFCGQDDVDFGASPNLFRDSDGRLIVGMLQKSGTYHALDAETMEPVWTARQLAARSAGGNAASSAYDDDAIYVTTNDALYALDKDTGEQLWKNAEGRSGYSAVAVANGVAYLLSPEGNVLAFDTADGTLLSTTKLTTPEATCSAVAGGGVVVARNTLYAACDSGSGVAEVVPNPLPGVTTGPQAGVLFAVTL